MIGKKVYGEGRLPCRLLLVGEGPGLNESIHGRPFIGASGADLDWVFLKRAAKLHRQDFYITNIVKWRTNEDDDDPTPREIARDEGELLTEIELCNPEIIVAVGAVAARWFMQTDEVDLEKYAGVPVPCPRYPDKILICTWHPAAALRMADRYYHLVYWCFEQVGRLVRGEISCHSPQAEVHYHYGDGPESLPPGTRLGVDTEGLVSDPWGLSAAGEEGRAVVLRRAEARGADLKRRWVVGHNILHDIDVLEALDAPIDPDKADDSMLAAYLLPWLPRRLKALAFKLLGVHQSEYKDIITPAEGKICQEYFRLILENRCTGCGGSGTVSAPYKRIPSKSRSIKCNDCGGDCTAWPKPESKLVFDGDPGGKLYTPRSIGRTVRAALERGIRLRESWTNYDETVRETIEQQLGRLRQPTLDDIDPEIAKNYAAADADLTLQVWNKLEPILKQNGLWQVYQIDRGIVPIINRMHRNGILIDKQHFVDLHKQFQEEKAKVRGSLVGIKALYGWAEGKHGADDINPGSPTQIAHLLYDVMKLKPYRGSRSTDDKTLEALRIKNKGNQIVEETLNLIGEYRELDKMDGTYAVPIPQYADGNNRVHPRFLLHVTASGRIASRDFNCFSRDTEVLTRKGWIRFDELGREKIAQWDAGIVSFVQPTGYVSKLAELTHIYNQHIDLAVTPDHRCLLQNTKTKDMVVVAAKDYPNFEHWQLHGGTYSGTGVTLTDTQLQLIIAAQADGSWNRKALDFTFKKARKIDRFRMLITALGLRHTESVGVNGRTRFYIPANQVTWVYKILGKEKVLPWSLCFALSVRQARVVLDECMFWDGCWTRKNHYASAIKQNADVIATLFTLQSKRAVVRKYVSAKGSMSWQVDVTHKNYSLTTNFKREDYGYNTVFCVSVPSSYLLVRRGGKVMVTGQCQNIPTRTERGRLIRKGFIAKPGCKLVSIDLDQIELRVVAHLSQDPNLIDVFVGAETCPINLAKGKCTCHDIHIRTAALVYNKGLDEITTQERLLAKTINFLILYGGGPGKLQSELALLGIVVSREQCVEYVNGWYEAYPGVRDYVAACHAQAKESGYVTDLFGRRRYVQGVWSCVERVSEESLKWAVNTPDQGTAAGILKLWMRRVWDNVLPNYRRKGIYVEPLLTIHDEIILEAEESVCGEVIEACIKQAALTLEMAVPIRAKGAAAYNWSELK